MRAGICRLVNLEAVAPVILGNADEVKPREKGLENFRVAVNEDHTSITSPGFVLGALCPIKDRTSDKQSFRGETDQLPSRRRPQTGPNGRSLLLARSRS